MLVDWANSVGSAHWKSSQIDGTKSVPRGYSIANKLVFKKVREALGFDRLLCAYTGAAPVQAQTIDFFAQLGIGIYEGFLLFVSVFIFCLVLCVKLCI